MTSRRTQPGGRGRIDERSQVSPRRPDGSRGRVGPHLGPVRLTPTRLTLGIALVGSALFVLYALTVRDAAAIPMLASGALVLGIVFAALAIAGGVATYRAASDGRSAAALGQALLGGIAAIIACGCIAVSIVLVLLWRTPA
jgi:hypothetical protein